MRRFSLLMGVAWLVTACTPTCDASCRKVLSCGNDSERVSFDECVNSCETDRQLYRTWEDDLKIEAFKEHRRCLMSSTCDEIDDGVCYDELLFPYKTDVDAPGTFY